MRKNITKSHKIVNVFSVKEKADDVPAMLSKNEFVMTADAVKAAGDGDANVGAQRMYDLMHSLEAQV